MATQALKRFGQTCLKQMGIYHRLRASLAYDLYWSAADRSLITDRRREVEFYRTLLNGFHAGDLVFDIGANLGHKTGIFLRLGARVVAVDPDPENAKILEESFLRYRLVPKPVSVVTKAASDRTSKATLYIDEPGSAKNTLSQKWVDTLRDDAGRFGRKMTFGESKEVQTTTLQDLVRAYGSPFFIKIDVEGYEPAVLRGLHRSVPYLSYEVNLPEFRSEGLECVDILNRLNPGGTFNYAVDCRAGLVLENWIDAQGFSALLARCANSSIEVFWKTPANP
jgi:FkbM family methyltransferase